MRVNRVREKEISLILLDFPVNPQANRLTPDWERFLKYNQELLRSICKQHSIPYISREILPEFMDDDFIDMTHLNKEGRNKMTEYLSERIIDLVLKLKKGSKPVFPR